jgi:hypothetical protein
MLFPEFARSPRRLLALYLTGAVAAVVCLAWLGWRLLDQEKLGESQAAESREAYERIVVQFADQKAVADETRKRLGARGAAAPVETGLVWNVTCGRFREEAPGGWATCRRTVASKYSSNGRVIPSVV